LNGTGLLRRGVLAGIVIFLAVMALVVGVFYIAHSERQFELDRWQAKLRAGSAPTLVRIGQWLAESRHQLRNVAVNPTVQIFLLQTSMPDSGVQAAPESQAQATFLASYVASLSVRGPFAMQGSPFAGGMHHSASGLAVLDAHRNIVAATFGYRPSPSLISALIASMKNGSAGPLPSGAQSAFARVILPMQGGLGVPIGYVIGERNFAPTFWGSGSAAAVEGGHESLIALGRDGTAQVITSSIEPERAGGEVAAARSPAHLLRATDFTGQDALHLAVPVVGAPWMLVETIPAQSALAGVDDQIRSLVIILLLALLAIIAAILALWRHTAGLRAVEAREASVKLYRNVIELLLLAIDQRDPGAAAHSRRVAALSRAVAVNMGMAPQEADTVELAGALLNVGKLFVPAELLTKAAPLDEAERRIFGDGTARWLDLLSGAPLDPALEPILRAALRLAAVSQEAAAPVPRGAYIIIAANAAVALMSQRAWRAPRSANEAIELLRGMSLTIPEPVLASLCQVLVSDVSANI
jgi:HD-GYP domain-containing protein (c-di-GMP phosphodiesterase class II)